MLKTLEFNDIFSMKLSKTDLGKKFWKTTPEGSVVVNVDYLADALNVQFHTSNAGYVLYVDRDEQGVHHIRVYDFSDARTKQWAILLGLTYLSLHYGKRNFPMLQMLSKAKQWQTNQRDASYVQLYRLAMDFFAPVWFTQKMAEQHFGGVKITSANLEQFWPAYWEYAKKFVLPKHVLDQGYMSLHTHYENYEYIKRYVQSASRGGRTTSSSGQMSNCDIAVLALELGTAAITPFLF